MAKEEYKLMTVKELAEKILALPEEQQNFCDGFIS